MEQCKKESLKIKFRVSSRVSMTYNLNLVLQINRKVSPA